MPKNWLFGIVVGLALYAFGTEAQAQLAHVVVTAPRTDGGNVICSGSACADVLADLQNQARGGVVYDYEQPLEDIAIDHSLFCAALKQAKPSGCDINNPPIVPGINLSWQPNGCGTGPVEDFIYERGLGALNSSFSGNLDAPYAGVSFLSACNSHDFCYGVGSVRESCDIDFRDAMQSSCDAFSDPSAYQACSSFVSTYHAAVSSNFGTRAYNNANADLRCAVWAKDMEENQCPA